MALGKWHQRSFSYSPLNPTPTHKHTWDHTHKHVHAHTYPHMHTHAHIHKHTCTCMHTQIHTHTHTCVTHSPQTQRIQFKLLTQAKIYPSPPSWCLWNKTSRSSAHTWAFLLSPQATPPVFLILSSLVWMFLSKTLPQVLSQSWMSLPPPNFLHVACESMWLSCSDSAVCLCIL